MSKIISAALIVLGVMAVIASAFGAELALPAGAQLRHRHLAPACRPCGCLHVSFVYHRDLRTTYGTGFDPRNFDQAQPYFYPGRVYAYPRYWVDPIQCPLVN